MLFSFSDDVSASLSLRDPFDAGGFGASVKCSVLASSNHLAPGCGVDAGARGAPMGQEAYAVRRAGAGRPFCSR